MEEMSVSRGKASFSILGREPLYKTPLIVDLKYKKENKLPVKLHAPISMNADFCTEHKGSRRSEDKNKSAILNRSKYAKVNLVKADAWVETAFSTAKKQTVIQRFGSLKSTGLEIINIPSIGAKRFTNAPIQYETNHRRPSKVGARRSTLASLTPLVLRGETVA